MRARLRRRMSSSDLPENMGPVMTSMRPGMGWVIVRSLCFGYLAILNGGEMGRGGFPGRFFCWCGGVAFLQGFLRKVVCETWCFGGEFVVNCVVDVVV